jgi:hypothetical protein
MGTCCTREGVGALRAEPGGWNHCWIVEWSLDVHLLLSRGARVLRPPATLALSCPCPAYHCGRHGRAHLAGSIDAACYHVLALENVLSIYNRTSRGTWVTSQIVSVIDRPHRCGLRCARATRQGWHELAGPRPTQRDDIGVIFARSFATSARSARPRASASIPIPFYVYKAGTDHFQLHADYSVKLTSSTSTSFELLSAITLRPNSAATFWKQLPASLCA